MEPSDSAKEISLMKADVKELLDPRNSVRHRSQILSLHRKICAVESFLQRKLPSIVHEKERLEAEVKEAISELASFSYLGWVSEDVWPESIKKAKRKLHSAVKKMEKFDRNEEDDVTKPADSGDESLSAIDDIFGLDLDLRMLIEDVALTNLTELRVVILYGMAGIGKTTLVSIVYDDPYIKEAFPTRIWVTVSSGRDQIRDIMFKILDSLFGHDDYNHDMSETELKKCVRSELEGKKYLVVIDGVCELMNWEFEEESFFPENNNGSRIIVTTRVFEVVENCYNEEFCADIYHLRLLDQNTSWDLLRKKVFGEEDEDEDEEEEWKQTKRELEGLGRKIARNCGGVPCAIIAAGNHLSKAENMTAEYWERVADSGNSFIHDAAMEEEKATLTSVKMFLIQLLQEPDTTSSTMSQISSLYDNISSLEEMLLSASRNSTTNSHGILSEREIREAIYQTKYCIELSSIGWRKSFSQDLIRVIEKVNSILRRMNGKFDDPSPSLGVNVPPDIKRDEIVGRDRDLEILKEEIKSVSAFRRVITIFGMAGIGKSTVTSILYDDPFVKNEFPTRIWVAVSSKDRIRDVLRMLCYLSLQNTKYFIVLDGIRDDGGGWGKYSQLIPKDRNKGSVIVQTTQLKGVVRHSKKVHEIRPLGDSESWELLRRKVFGKDEDAPWAVQKLGRLIAKNCQGLPIAILAAAKHLSKAENKKVPEYWKRVAESGNALISSSEEGELLKNRLYPSYQTLPENLKPFFFYTGIFPRHAFIPASKLVKLWAAEEGFSPEEKDARNILKELIDRSVILVRQHSSTSSHRIKTCVLHYVLWEICSEEIRRNGFFRTLDRYNDVIEEDETTAVTSISTGDDSSRLCIHNNVLLGFEDVRDAVMESDTIPSFLCIAPYLPYPLMELSFGPLRMLKILDAITIRLYVIPPGIFELFQLKYLALTYGGVDSHLPSAVLEIASNLKKLRFLFILRPSIAGTIHVIETVDYSPLLPSEIWGMPELEHLQVTGADLPVPDGSCTVLLPELSTLSDVGPRTCTKEVIQKLPNLKKLGVTIELDGSDSSLKNRPLDELASLKSLESFKCAVVNPDFGSPPCYRVILLMPDRRSVFPSSLTRLTLSGCGFGWEDMNKIAPLPWLASLKLQCNAFRGPKWTADEDGFSSLRYLLLEDLDLVEWTIPRGLAFRLLKHLKISHCYRLEGIPDAFAKFLQVKLIEIEDCNPLAIASSARKIEERQAKWAAPQHTDIRVHYSWDSKRT